MNILIIGSGNCGITYAADLTLKGHKVSLLKSSSRDFDVKTKFIIKNNNTLLFKDNGNLNKVTISKITDSYDEAFLEDRDIIIICSQTNYHEEIIKKIKPYIIDSDVIFIQPGYASTAYFIKNNIKCTIAEAQSSPIDCRVNAHGEAEVLFKNVRNPIGIYPKKNFDAARIKLEQLEFNFVYLKNIFEAALHNPNLIVHTIGAIMSIPRIEYSKGDYWMYKEVFTPSVWNLVENLDQEKNNILLSLGLPKLSYVDACKYRNFQDLSIDSKSAFFDYAMNHSPKGPDISDSRYITEDVSQGLVLLESLGELLNIETPLVTSLINLANFSLNRNFRINGRTVENLGLTTELINLLVKE